ncbi:eukaryotic translation initiation factor 4E transporter isoform X2 [Protopterus annectens]|uniref:eukaryotic translation initiation factor 4E transporter isoform X2 n=1 Tax=Protopterus annectens TaxID=7888 RepID=UPI001CFB2853|nr:eukaryotic translation initiation factor 4E transporter isoform X2 [Protopterus annectens]
MEKSISEPGNGEGTMLIKLTFGRKSQFRYSKEELLEIKESPYSKQRPGYLLDKFDSDGIWDPEKWHASLYQGSGRCSPVEGGTKKDVDSDRTSLKRRIPDPRERAREDDDVVLIPQRRSFGGGCHVTSVSSSRQAGSPSEGKENENVQRSGRRIGSGRIVASRAFEARPSDKDFREQREARERDKEKRFRREPVEGRRPFAERKRNDSYTEEEPEWFVAGPTSQSETIELTGFDDKVLEDDQKKPKRSRKQSFKEEVQCNGGEVLEEEVLSQDASADQEVPREEVLPPSAPGEFDFNEFFNLDKTGLASMIEDVLNEGSVSSRFSQWFNNSRSGSHSSSLRSTPHEELEKLAGNSGVVLSVEEVEAKLKNLMVEPDGKNATAFMVEQLEERFASVSNGRAPWKRDNDMSAFNKLVSSMKASGTLPTQPKSNQSENHVVPSVLEGPSQHPLPKNILQEILGPQMARPPSDVLSSLLRGSEPNSLIHGQRGTAPLHPFPPRASAEYLGPRMPSPVGFAPGHTPLIGEPYHQFPNAPSPVPRQGISRLEMQQAVLDGLPFPPEFAVPAGNLYLPGFGKLQHDRGRDGYRSRQPRMTRPPGIGHRMSSPVLHTTVTSMLSPSFTPTSVIRKMYESKERNKEESTLSKSPDAKEGQKSSEDTTSSSFPQAGPADRETSLTVVGKSCIAPRSSGSTLLDGSKFSAEQDLRPTLAGRKTPTMDSSISRPPFLRPVCQVPLVPHFPVVRPVHHQLHPGMVQRLLPPPQHLQPLLQAVLAAGPSVQGSGTAVQNLHQNTSLRTGQSQQRRSPRSSSPVGLAKWFGSDVLQQPLPSMPAKVIRVDELEFRQ